jgi:hypothetical protein
MRNSSERAARLRTVATGSNGSKPATRIHGDPVIRSRDSVQELRLLETLWNYARNRVTDQASFCRANPVSFSRAPQAVTASIIMAWDSA